VAAPVRILPRPTPADRLRIPVVVLLCLGIYVPVLVLMRLALPHGAHLPMGLNFSFGLVTGASIGLYSWPLREVAWRGAVVCLAGAIASVAVAWLVRR